MTYNLPNDCLAHIFHFLAPFERKQCSLVCKNWLQVEGQTRHRLSLKAQHDLISIVPSFFSRYDSITKLSLKCHHKSLSINDEAFVIISLYCQNLICLKLQSCREITHLGMEHFAKNCQNLKKISVGSCSFGKEGIDAITENCQNLEELVVKRLRGISGYRDLTEVVKSCNVGCSSLKSISLKDLCNAEQYFGQLISGSKNLTTLRLFRCSGDWDQVLKTVSDNVNGLVELHLEKLQVSDIGLAAVSKCETLEILHLLKTPDCSNLGVMLVAERCKALRKVHVDGWKTNRIDDIGLISVAKHCPKLQELVLINVNVTCASLEPLAVNCRNLERLALCGSETIGDDEISCVASKCKGLRKLYIKSCPVSDIGLEALVVGCPNLVAVKVKKCKGVTNDGASRLMASRKSLTVYLDTTVVAI